ncbi:hypothetical protein, partial [Marinobacter halodurans]|uniref:hypothetical protein n=1 Tax=Marinobacter halodurans TaxID=2528979 RepID=UPI001A954D79
SILPGSTNFTDTLATVSVQKQVFRVDERSTSKSFFLITGSDMLFNNADKIAKRMIRFFISETKNPMIAISSVIRC